MVEAEHWQITLLKIAHRLEIDQMRILYLSYWVFNDALTTVTVLPHLCVLEEQVGVEVI